MTKASNGASATGKDICYVLCVVHRAAPFVCDGNLLVVRIGGKDVAEAVHLEAKT